MGPTVHSDSGHVAKNANNARGPGVQRGPLPGHHAHPNQRNFAHTSASVDRVSVAPRETKKKRGLPGTVVPERSLPLAVGDGVYAGFPRLILYKRLSENTHFHTSVARHCRIVW